MSVLVVGGGVAGLGSALALSDAGFDVTIIERDEVTLPATPDEAFDGWPRRGAPQVRHSHAFLARLRNLLRDRNPKLLADLLAAGATELRFTERLPETLTDTDPRPGDEDLVALACRRTTFEWVLRRDALEARDVRMIQGVVAGLVGEPGRVRGVRLEDGTELLADWVVDASGRRSPLPSWLAALGGPPLVEREEDTGIVYSSRFYRLRSDAELPPVEGMSAGDLGYLKFAVFIGDNRTYSITFGLPSEDSSLRELLREPGFTRAASAVPALAPWVDPAIAEPLTDVEVMARLLNRSRRFLLEDGSPVVTGLSAVGDAHTCTNPLYGRGCSLGFVSAHLLADALAAHRDDPLAAALAYEESMAREVHPWYRSSVAQDRQDRSSRGLAVSDDDEGALLGGAGGAGDGLDAESARSLLRDGLFPATRTDPVVFRAFLRTFNLLDPPDRILRDPDVIGRVLTVWQDRDNREEPPPAGPDRDALLALL
ncbi:MAG TPA: tryptophan 7-halogenase [Acidimicrobiales bacterium]|nr:tryptophan 7-halogenase [Acidimicrobiales bacterium]